MTTSFQDLVAIHPEAQQRRETKLGTEQNDSDYGFWLDVMKVAADTAVRIHGTSTTPTQVDAMFLVMERRLRADAATPAAANTPQS